jgi:hypothetical protein
MNGMRADRERERERAKRRRSLHARWAREWREKRKLNWSIGSIIDGNQYNEIFQLNETYSIKKSNRGD